MRCRWRYFSAETNAEIANQIIHQSKKEASRTMVQATTGVLTAELDPIQIRTWITQLAGFDIIYTTAGILFFETILNAE